MNKVILAPISALVAVGLKQYLGLDFTETEVEAALTFAVTVGSAVWAAFLNPKKV